MKTVFVQGLTAVLALLCAAEPASAKTTEILVPRETRLDPSTLSPAPRTFRDNDVLLRIYVRAPTTAVVEEARTVVVDGFPVQLPKDLALTERAFVRSPNPRMFSKADGQGNALEGAIFCNKEWLKLGPFTTGENLSRFTAIPCFIDAQRDGVFDAVAFFSVHTRDAGPVPIAPLRYHPVLGAFEHEHVDLLVRNIDADHIFTEPMLYDAEGKHGRIRMFTDERDGTATDYAHGCTIATPGGTGVQEALGARIAITAVDPGARTFQATVTQASGGRHIAARIQNYQYMYDFLPRVADRCGTPR